jgi:hypothetical protein
MTWCETQFTNFNEKLKLDSTRRQRIVGAVARFQQFCQTDEELSAASAGEVFLQGSVATGAVIKPLADDEFDVDAVYPFDLNVFQGGITPAQLIQWFISRLQSSEFYKNNLLPRDRCARIDYAGDFHIDIIPATSSIAATQPYAVPAKDLGSWVVNDPIGYANWVKAIDRNAVGVDQDGVSRFVRSCRMMKRWRDEIHQKLVHHQFC